MSTPPTTTTTSTFTYAIPNSKRYPIENDYELKEQLGDGQYSVVRQAVHILTGEAVAIKFVHRSQTEASELINEVSLMRDISDHPGFVQLYDVYEDEKHYILVMELVRGGELFDKIAQLTAYTEEKVASLVFQVASTLNHMHSKKIVHRDLKPENLLFVDAEATIIKLCDFGVAEKIPERGYLTEIIGTESYMAPEVEEGKPYGLSSDMYGLGVILYIMLCGYPPFEPENGITELEFPEEEWSDISTSVKDLITSLLQSDPLLRPTAEQVMHHPWVSGGDKLNKEKQHLNGTVKTMKLYNEYRASGSFGSMRAVKAGKKEAVWSIFAGSGGATPNKKGPKKPKVKNSEPSKKPKMDLKPIEIPKDPPKDKEKLIQTTSQKKIKKKESEASSPRNISLSTTKDKPDSSLLEKKKAGSDNSINISTSTSTNTNTTTNTTYINNSINTSTSNKSTPRSISVGSPRDIRVVKTSEGAHVQPAEIVFQPADVSLENHGELVKTVSLLESKLVSLSNINCALQSQIDEINSAFHKMKAERDEIKKERDMMSLELETLKFKLEKKEKKKEKKQ